MSETAADTLVSAGMAPVKRSRPSAPRTGIAVSYLIVIVGGLVLLLPFLFMLSTSFKEEHEAYLIPPTLLPAKWMWSNYSRAIFDYFNVVQYGGNTMIISVGVLGGRIVSASLVAFGFARIRFFGHNVLFILVLSTLMVPQQVTIIPLYILFKNIDWLNTFLPLIVPSWFGGGAFFIFLLRQFIMTINPELDDAARIDGCGWFGIYYRIVLPLIKPALATVAIISFLDTWSDYFGPLIFLRSAELFTLSIGLHSVASGSSPLSIPEKTVIMAESTIMMIPPLLLFLFAQRYFIRGIVFSGLKG
jgi:multiple sugar transport system permease protein